MYFEEKDAEKYWCPKTDARSAMVDPIRGAKTGCLGAKCAAWVFSDKTAGFGGCAFVLGPRPQPNFVAPAIAREDDTSLGAINRGGKPRR